jgi:hypothetical protein
MSGSEEDGVSARLKRRDIRPPYTKPKPILPPARRFTGLRSIPRRDTTARDVQMKSSSVAFARLHQARMNGTP